MAHADQPAETSAPETLETEIEATRERLAGTIDQLLYRASPKTIVLRRTDSVKAQFVDAAGNPRTNNIIKAAGAVVGLVAVILVIRRLTK